jgi:hypothetical protein
MEIKHTSHRGTSPDTVGDALAALRQLFEHRTAEEPVSIPDFWRFLRERGFYFVENGPFGRLGKVIDSDPRVETWGVYFARLMLDHAVELGLIRRGRTAETYIAKG